MSTPEWIEQNREALGDLADNETLSRYSDIPSLAKGLVEKQSAIGSMIRIPGEDASKESMQEFTEKLVKVPGVARLPTESDDTEGWEALYKKLGRPDSEDGYTLDGLEEDKIDQGRFDAVRKKAYAMGLNNKQLQSLMQADAKYQAEREEEAIGEVRQQAEALKQEWGADYERRVNAALDIAKNKGGDDFAGLLKSFPDMAKHPGFLRTFEKLAREFTGDNPRIDPQPEGVPTPEEASMKIQEIRQNPEHPYNNPNLMGKAKRAVMRQMYELLSYADGKRPTPEGYADIDDAYP